MKTGYYAGLQSLALALIFMPEPFTTPIGIGLLSYATVANRQRPAIPRRVINTFEDHYSYKIKLVKGTAIKFELSPRRYGQMPKVYPSIARLQANPPALKAPHERPQRQAQVSYTPFSRVEPAGLMKPTRPKGQTRYFVSQR